MLCLLFSWAVSHTHVHQCAKVLLNAKAALINKERGAMSGSRGDGPSPCCVWSWGVSGWACNLQTRPSELRRSERRVWRLAPTGASCVFPRPLGNQKPVLSSPNNPNTITVASLHPTRPHTYSRTPSARACRSVRRGTQTRARTRTACQSPRWAVRWLDFSLRSFRHAWFQLG